MTALTLLHIPESRIGQLLWCDPTKWVTRTRNKVIRVLNFISFTGDKYIFE